MDRGDYTEEMEQQSQMRRIIEYQVADGKWYKKEVWDLIDPLDETDSLIAKLQTEIERLKKALKPETKLILIMLARRRKQEILGKPVDPYPDLPAEDHLFVIDAVLDDLLKGNTDA
jgi:hypothetical protein